MTSSFLARITASRRADAERRAPGALADVREEAAAAAPALDFHAALAAPPLALVAEVKRASPSAGAIADVDPAAQAATYQAAGARAVSVLTEPDHFGGSLDDLRAVRAAVTIPVLRKDFLCHPLHVWEARAAGADAVLLIVAALGQSELSALMDLAESTGMTPLVEVHSTEEAERAIVAGARVIGINTRDLATLRVDPGVVGAVRPSIPQGTVVVGESGVRTREDVDRLAAAGVDAVLVGEALMRAPDAGAKVRELIGRGRP